MGRTICQSNRIYLAELLRAIYILELVFKTQTMHEILSAHWPQKTWLRWLLLSLFTDFLPSVLTIKNCESVRFGPYCKWTNSLPQYYWWWKKIQNSGVRGKWFYSSQQSKQHKHQDLYICSLSPESHRTMWRGSSNTSTHNRVH